MSEEPSWHPLPNHPKHQINRLGQLRKEGRLLSRYVDKDGYICVNVGTSTYFVHRLLMLAFVGPPADETLVVRHLDGDPLNNDLSNLAWGTQSENMYDQVRHRTHWNATKTHCPHGHAYDAANTSVSKDGSRRCRACSRAEALRRYHRNKRAAS